MRRIAAVVVGLLLATPSWATVYPGFRLMITDSVTQNPSQTLTRPDYANWKLDPVHGVNILRAADNQNTPFNFFEGGGGVWGYGSRHHYSKDQPWSRDGRWYVMEMEGGVINGVPNCATCKSEIILDATRDYRPWRKLDCPGLPAFRDQRWWPRINQPNYMVGIYDIGGHPRMELRDVINCNSIAVIELNDSLGAGDATLWGNGGSEMTMTLTGRFMAVAKWGRCPTDPTASCSVPPWRDGILAVQIVDLDSLRTGPVNLIADTLCGRQTADRSSAAYHNCASSPTPWATGFGATRIDSTVGSPNNWQLSPTGAYFVLHYGKVGSTEAHRVFDVDTLGDDFGLLTAHNYTIPSSGPCASGTSSGCYRRTYYASGDTLAGAKGWAVAGKHSDIVYNRDSLMEYLVPITNDKPDQPMYIGAQNLSTGYVTPLFLKSTADPKRYEPLHISARNMGRPGWVLVTGGSVRGDLDGTTGDTLNSYKPYWDSLWMLKTDGSGSVQRFAKARTLKPDDAAYRTEAHGVADWEGKRAAWASNWQRNCTGGCGTSAAQYVDYIADLHCLAPRLVNNLSITIDAESWSFSFTAPGEDTLRFGTPDSVQIAVSTSPITSSTFLSSTILPPFGGVIVSTRFGKTYTYAAANVSTPDTPMYAAVRVRATCGVWSEISNLACTYVTPTTNSCGGGWESHPRHAGGRDKEVAD